MLELQEEGKDEACKLRFILGSPGEGVIAANLSESQSGLI